MFDLFSRRNESSLLLIVMLLFTLAATARGQTTSFTYQGRLSDGGTPANGNYDLQFTLWDSLDGGTQIGSTQTIANVSVSAGIFTVQLDFGANAFSGASRFLEISARLSGAGSFTLLTPRQQITSTPYAVRSLAAASADTTTNSTQLGGVPAANYVQTNDSRLSDPRPPTPGSSNYIQNAMSQQASANFNISGNGTAGGTLSANAVTASSGYNIGGNRVLSVGGSNNLIAGISAGANNTGTDNSFFGTNAGTFNATGSRNSFFGSSAGVGVPVNTTGSANSFFGHNAGSNNTTGGVNSFFGESAGQSNTMGNNNSFFGEGAGKFNTTGNANSIFGRSAGQSISTTGLNTILGFAADGLGVTNSTAIGARAFVAQSNSLVLGSINGVNNATADTNVGIGTTAPGSVLHVIGSQPPPVSSGNGTNATPVLQVIGGKGGNTTDTKGGLAAPGGDGASVLIQAGDGGDNLSAISFTARGGSITLQPGLVGICGPFPCVPVFAGNVLLAPSGGNVGIGTNNSTLPRLEVSGGGFENDVLITDNNTTATTVDINNSSAGGRTWRLQSVGGGVAGRIGNFEIWNTSGPNVLTIQPGGNVGIGVTTNPQDSLDVNGIIRVSTLGSAGATQLCRNASNQIATCSSSLRYKKDVARFVGGLSVVSRLHPITFRWKTDQTLDVGLGAEDVAAVEPLLVTHNSSGQVEGVKYDRLSAVFINAFKEQQAQIERQQAEAKQQQDQIAALRVANAALNARLRAIEKTLKKNASARRRR